jgi:hypothetical protein
MQFKSITVAARYPWQIVLDGTKGIRGFSFFTFCNLSVQYHCGYLRPMKAAW